MNFTANQTQTANAVNDSKLETLFSGLGLDSYIANVSPTHTHTAAVKSPTETKDAASLSLQEKQR